MRPPFVSAVRQTVLSYRHLVHEQAGHRIGVLRIAVLHRLAVGEEGARETVYVAHGLYDIYHGTLEPGVILGRICLIEGEDISRTTVGQDRPQAYLSPELVGDGPQYFLCFQGRILSVAGGIRGDGTSSW